jgi:cardiolipin synthase (CMP-forming)
MSQSLISVPNALTFLRFLGIPVFIYLTLWVEAEWLGNRCSCRWRSH